MLLNARRTQRSKVGQNGEKSPTGHTCDRRATSGVLRAFRNTRDGRQRLRASRAVAGRTYGRARAVTSPGVEETKGLNIPAQTGVATSREEDCQPVRANLACRDKNYKARREQHNKATTGTERRGASARPEFGPSHFTFSQQVRVRPLYSVAVSELHHAPPHQLRYTRTSVLVSGTGSRA